MNHIFSKYKKLLLCILYVLACVLVYTLVKGHSLRIVNLTFIWAIAVMGVSVMLGMTGKITFAGIAFFGIGAYTVANLTTGSFGFTVSSLWALLAGAIVAGIVGCAIGAIILRLNGAFFLFSTICIVQIFYNLFINYAPLFGGPAGIVGVPPFSMLGFTANSQKKWFIVVAVFLGLIALLVERIRSTRLGRSLASIRDDETVAQTIGIDTYKAKVIAFTTTSMLSGLAGGLYAMLNTYIGYDMFTYAKSTNLVVMAMIGGVNNTVGIILGSLIITVIPEVFRNLAGWFRLAYGIAIVLLMIFLPTGFVGLFPKMLEGIQRLWNKRKVAVESRKGGPR